jgi:long-chain acyl-CoA synthetase
MDYKKWVTVPQMTAKPPFTLPTVSTAAVDGETIPRRHPEALNGFLAMPEEGCHTLYDVLIRARKKFGDKNGLGTRALLDKHIETKTIKKTVDGKEINVPKEWTYFELGPYSWTTFGEYVELALQLGAGFRKLGLSKGDKVHVYAATR